MALLEVDDLRVVFARRGERSVTAVDGVSFTVEPGQTVGLVGESGCGKSVTSLAMMRLLPRRGNRVTGRVLFEGTDLLGLTQAEMRDRRGRDISMIFQDPLSSLNPVVPLGVQVAEVLRRHRGQDRRESTRHARELLGEVGIPDPGRRLREYPHQISGGMRQRVLIAMALACRPRLLIADEPTTALDVTIQAQILALLQRLVDQTGTALILITHDLGVVAGVCDTVNVLYSGRIVESADRYRLFGQPRHPYTEGLLRSVPRLNAPGLDAPAGEAPGGEGGDRPTPAGEAPGGGRGGRAGVGVLRPIPGSVADIIEWSQGCAFAPRCERSVDACVQGTPPLESDGYRLLRCKNPVGTAAGERSAVPR